MDACPLPGSHPTGAAQQCLKPLQMVLGAVTPMQTAPPAPLSEWETENPTLC